MINMWTNPELWKEHGLFRENLTVLNDLNEGLENEWFEMFPRCAHLGEGCFYEKMNRRQ